MAPVLLRLPAILNWFTAELAITTFHHLLFRGIPNYHPPRACPFNRNASLLHRSTTLTAASDSELLCLHPLGSERTDSCNPFGAGSSGPG